MLEIPFWRMAEAAAEVLCIVNVPESISRLNTSIRWELDAGGLRPPYNSGKGSRVSRL